MPGFRVRFEGAWVWCWGYRENVEGYRACLVVVREVESLHEICAVRPTYLVCLRETD